MRISERFQLWSRTAGIVPAVGNFVPSSLRFSKKLIAGFSAILLTAGVSAGAMVVRQDPVRGPSVTASESNTQNINLNSSESELQQPGNGQSAASVQIDGGTVHVETDGQATVSVNGETAELDNGGSVTGGSGTTSNNSSLHVEIRSSDGNNSNTTVTDEDSDSSSSIKIRSRTSVRASAGQEVIINKSD